MIEDLVIYVDRKTSKIYKRDPKNIIKYQCNRQEVSLIEKMRKLDPPDDVVAGWGRYSNFGPSNMQRTEDKNLSYGTLLEAVPGLLKLFSDKNRKSIKMYK